MRKGDLMPKLRGTSVEHEEEIRRNMSDLRFALGEIKSAATCKRRWGALRKAEGALEAAFAAAYSAMSDNPGLRNIDIDLSLSPERKELDRLRAAFRNSCLRDL